MKDTIIGVDLAKRVFRLHDATMTGHVRFRKKLTRAQFRWFMAEHPPCMVVFEACGSLADEDFVRIILDGTVIKTRIDRRATNISVLAAIGVRRDGRKGLLSILNMGGESTAAWRQFFDDLEPAV
mgnify:CR=1 FL=1